MRERGGGENEKLDRRSAESQRGRRGSKEGLDWLRLYTGIVHNGERIWY